MDPDSRTLTKGEASAILRSVEKCLEAHAPKNPTVTELMDWAQRRDQQLDFIWRELWP